MKPVSTQSRTLRVLTLHALTERRGNDEHPTGWVSGSREWIAERTALTERTVTRHVDLIDAGELVVWAPHRRRSGRAREYLVVHMATPKQVRRAEKRDTGYKRNRNPDSVRPSRVD